MFQKEEFLSTLTALVRENLHDEGFGVEVLAAKIFLSRTQLFRRVKALTGGSTLAFVAEQRLLMAYGLLTAADPPSVKDVALRCGYNSPNYFNRAFRRRFGLTPGRLRGRQEKMDV